MGAVSEFIRELQSYEEYAFSLQELKRTTKAPESSLRKELSRLANDQQILNLRKGFYLILPPRYQSYAKLPVGLYVDKLFNFLNKPYYVGFYSAAAQHGASHQQIQQDYIITTPPALRDISKGNMQLRFFKRELLRKIQNPGELDQTIKAMQDSGYIKLEGNLIFPKK